MGTSSRASHPRFVKPPQLEWHGKRPFAVAQMQPDYATGLELLAPVLEQRILCLPVTEGWEAAASGNPTGSRYGSYNALLLDPLHTELFLGIRTTARFLREQIGLAHTPTMIQSWLNVHRAGQRLGRHSHDATLIGFFIAYGKASTTSFGADRLGCLRLRVRKHAWATRRDPRTQSLPSGFGVERSGSPEGELRL